MAEISNYSKGKQVRGFLTVIAAAVLSACAVTYMMLQQYSREGTYRIEQVLLTPDNAVNLSFAESPGRTKELTRFDHFDFSYYDKSAKIKRVLNVEIERYPRFYDLVRNDVSIQSVPKPVFHSFDDPLRATLSLVVNSRDGGRTPLITVDFSPLGAYYRVQLRQQESADRLPWAYFYHPDIYPEAETIFTL